MKKKLFISLALIFAFVLVCATCLAACDKTPQEKEYNVNITLKVDDWTDGYNYIEIVSTVSMSAGNPFMTGDTLSSNNTVKENTVVTATITYKNGYNPNSVTVTEKDGKSFTKRVGTDSDAEKLYIDVTPNADENYEFTLSKPDAVYKSVGLDLNVNHIVDIVEATSHPVYNFLTNAQIYALSGDSQTEQWINISTAEGGGNLSQPITSDYKLKADISQNKTYLYVRFDKSNKQKLVYKINYLNNLFKLKNASSEYVKLTTYREQGSYTDKAYFDEEKQAYRFEINTSDLGGNSKLTLCDNIDGLKEALVYQEYSVKMNHAKFTFNENVDESITFTPVNNGSSPTKKTYDSAATFQFTIGSGANNRDVFNLNNLQFEIAGKAVTSRVEDYTLYITLNENESPFDYPGEKKDAFYIDIKKSSVEYDPYLLVNTVKTSKDLGYCGVIDNIDGNNVISKEQPSSFYYDKGVNVVEIPVKSVTLYKSFKLKLKLDDGEYIEKTFVSGVDFNIQGIDVAYEEYVASSDSINQLSLLKTYADPKIIWSSNPGDEGLTIGYLYYPSGEAYYKENSFIAYSVSGSNVIITFNVPDRTNMNVECFISDAVYQENEISFVIEDTMNDFTVKKDGAVVCEKDANKTNKFVLTEDLKLGAYKYEFTDSRSESIESDKYYINYYYEIKLYSNGKQFYTANYQLNGDYIDGTKQLSSDIADNWECESWYVILSDWQQIISIGNDSSLDSYNLILTGKSTFNGYDKVRVNVYIDKIEICIKSEIKQFENV